MALADSRTLPMVTGALGAFVVAWKVAHEARWIASVDPFSR